MSPTVYLKDIALSVLALSTLVLSIVLLNQRTSSGMLFCTAVRNATLTQTAKERSMMFILRSGLGTLGGQIIAQQTSMTYQQSNELGMLYDPLMVSLLSTMVGLPKSNFRLP